MICSPFLSSKNDSLLPASSHEPEFDGWIYFLGQFKSVSRIHAHFEVRKLNKGDVGNLQQVHVWKWKTKVLRRNVRCKKTNFRPQSRKEMAACAETLSRKESVSHRKIRAQILFAVRLRIPTIMCIMHKGYMQLDSYQQTLMNFLRSSSTVCTCCIMWWLGWSFHDSNAGASHRDWRHIQIWSHRLRSRSKVSNIALNSYLKICVQTKHSTGWLQFSWSKLRA
jgi:hypothetical protein